ncbi:protein of unknown function [Xenorhabdus poinarii G6]|uniref:Uncharacterized protein n=1 Tax=Xenorhabdus poinarii G6 TaxID=1354304 RepID=A0A068R2U1_9GAMM|nr:protein of unknown function [Xenorhabdus poinarii G6]
MIKQTMQVASDHQTILNDRTIKPGFFLTIVEMHVGKGNGLNHLFFTLSCQWLEFPLA